MLKRIYNLVVRERLPRKIGMLSGVAVRKPRWLDRTETFDGYETPYLEALEETITPGDHVILVGGGWGVSAVVAAQCAGISGKVDVYEASKEQLIHIKETISLNRTRAKTTVHHALVGPEVDVWGACSEANQLSGSDLPEADVLCIDAEGSELEILRDDFGTPSFLIVEYHGFLGAPKSDVEKLVEEAGYSVLNSRLEVEEKEVGILVCSLD